MTKAVLDSSALIAFINQEKGFESAEEYLPSAIMSSINIAEVVAVLSLVDVPEKTIVAIINDLKIDIINFDLEQALQTGLLRKKTKSFGLSLGDRACINLANTKKLPVVTADKAWNKLGLPILVVQIR